MRLERKQYLTVKQRYDFIILQLNTLTHTQNTKEEQDW